MTCGNCGMMKTELTRPSTKHSRVAYCMTCGAYTTYVPLVKGWLRNTRVPSWAKVQAADLYWRMS